MYAVVSSIERVRHPEISPLEISDFQVGGASLWEWSQGPGYPAALRRALERLHAGRSVARPGDAILTRVAGFDSVFVTGGRSEDTELRDEFSRLPRPATYAADPVFGGERGGFELLRTRGLSGWVVDLGKSQLKLAAPERHWIFPRDWTRLPPAGHVSLSAIPAQRRRLREFIALGLQWARADTGTHPQALAFALPCRLGDCGVPGSSSYAGMRNDGTLLSDALESAGLADIPLLVLNDAELAAHSALSDERLAAFRKILVLTLGFGIGAALIHRVG
jgi:hypothetical protein